MSAPAGTMVELTTSGADLGGRAWRSVGRFTAPVAGVIDTSVLAPDSGDWSVPAPDAPLCAMRFAATDAVPELFVPPAPAWPVSVSVAAGASLARRTVTRQAGADGVRLVTVDVAGRPGVLALPSVVESGTRLAGVACFGGSEGGHDSQVGHAALLASHGFAALAVSWVDEALAAEAIAEVPLERFDTALRWLADRVEVSGPVAAMGISRGSEGLLAAVCTGTTTPPAGLVLVSPSSVMWQAVGSAGEVPDTASWTRDGRPLPWHPVPTSAVMPQLIRNAWRVRRDIAAHRPSLLRLRPAYAAGVRADPGTAAIPSERARCPLLCLTGRDDQVWPAEAMAEALLARRHGPYPDAHVCYPDAGHLIRLGALPSDAQWTGGIALGGSREGVAAAQRDATTRVLTFLRTLVTDAAMPAPRLGQQTHGGHGLG